MPGSGVAGANTLILLSLQSVPAPPAATMEGLEDLTHLPSDIQNYMRKLAELNPPIYLTRKAPCNLLSGFTLSFTDEEIENYKEAFLEYDVDGSGSINIQGEQRTF